MEEYKQYAKLRARQLIERLCRGINTGLEALRDVVGEGRTMDGNEEKQLATACDQSAEKVIERAETGVRDMGMQLGYGVMGPVHGFDFDF